MGDFQQNLSIETNNLSRPATSLSHLHNEWWIVSKFLFLLSWAIDSFIPCFTVHDEQRDKSRSYSEVISRAVYYILYIIQSRESHTALSYHGVPQGSTLDPTLFNLSLESRCRVWFSWRKPSLVCRPGNVYVSSPEGRDVNYIIVQYILMNDKGNDGSNDDNKVIIALTIKLIITMGKKYTFHSQSEKYKIIQLYSTVPK